jgi:hypothetical protein
VELDVGVGDARDVLVAGLVDVVELALASVLVAVAAVSFRRLVGFERGSQLLGQLRVAAEIDPCRLPRSRWCFPSASPRR